MSHSLPAPPGRPLIRAEASIQRRPCGNRGQSPRVRLAGPGEAKASVIPNPCNVHGSGHVMNQSTMRADRTVSPGVAVAEALRAGYARAMRQKLWRSAVSEPGPPSCSGL